MDRQTDDINPYAGITSICNQASFLIIRSVFVLVKLSKQSRILLANVIDVDAWLVKCIISRVFPIPKMFPIPRLFPIHSGRTQRKAMSINY